MPVHTNINQPSKLSINKKFPCFILQNKVLIILFYCLLTFNKYQNHKQIICFLNFYK